MKTSIRILCTWLLLLPSLLLQATAWQAGPVQRTEVTGLVKDSKGNPLPGVTVTLTDGNRKTGTQTDVSGRFRISLLPNNTLQFSFVGCKVASVPVNGQQQLNVTLTETATEPM